MKRFRFGWIALLAALYVGWGQGDAFAQKIYWTDVLNGKIQSANLDGTGVTTVFDAVSVLPTGFTHPARPAFAVCMSCAKPLCQECATQWDGIWHCAKCLAAKRGSTKIAYVPALGSVRTSMNPPPVPTKELPPTAFPSGPTIDTVVDANVTAEIFTLTR